MKQLQYNTHLILISQYKILIITLIYFFIYLSFYELNLSYCMTEDPTLIADAKPLTKSSLTNIEQTIQRQINEFLGFKETIDQQALQISKLENQLHCKQAILSAIRERCSDSIADQGLQPYINQICKEFKEPLSYPWLERGEDY